MKCKYPFSGRQHKGAAFPCGQCLPCRIQVRRVWTHRIMLEASLWPSSAFVTLTFSDDKLPERGVSVSEHQAFMKAIRARYDKPVRFFMCAEYGDKTFRPHYHYALFNFPVCCGSGPVWIGRKYIPCTCSVCSFVSSVWGKGHVFVGKLERDSAGYVAGYVTKKMTKKDDERLKVVDDQTGEVFYLHPEFSKQSTNPGLAANVVPDVLAGFTASGLTDLPSVLRSGDKYLPLGRYLKGKMNESLQVSSSASFASIEARQMFSMLKGLKNDSIYPHVVSQGSAAVALRLVNSQSVLQLEQRFKRKGKSHEI